MNEHHNHTPLERVAQVFSDLFSPIVLPAYMMAVAMWLTPLVRLPESTRIISMVVVAVLTAIVPTAVIFTLIKMGKVKDVSLPSRPERLIPYGVSIVCYGLTVGFLYLVNAPAWLAAFFAGAALASLCAALITLKWKISAHSASVGGVTAAVTWMGWSGLLLHAPLWWISGIIMVCGAIGTSRLILDRHTPAQVFAGYALGIIAEMLMLSIMA